MMPNMPFCEFCIQLSDKLFHHHASASESRKETTFELHPELSRLFDTVQTCPLCALIWENLVISPSVCRLSPEDEAYQWFRYSPVLVEPEHGASFFPSLNIPNRCGVNNLAFYVSDCRGSSAPEYSCVDGQLSVFAAEDSAAYRSGKVAGRPQIENSGSEDAFSLLRRWLTCCVDTHAPCRRSFTGNGTLLDSLEGPLLPKRVVDVNPDGKSGSLRLLETKGLRGNFIALSHRWGSAEEMPLRTTTQNLKDHLVQIDATRLSKTFRDAIAVARAVDVRYLWIDSLCIIQDDLTDWEVEAESMGQIYEHALFTIAASTQFIASHEGLFFCLQTDFDRVEMPYFNPEGVVEGVFTVANWSQDLMQNPVASALSKRGWATQEWILSRRMVHYMDDSFSWVCNGLQKTAQNHLGVDTDLDEFHGNDWQQIVRLYTQRQLTFEKDRLAAIRGLASRFEQLRQHDRYLHGMWQEQLIQQLAWQKGEDDLKKNTSLPKVPSWSWASRIGPIKPVWTGDLNDEWESDCVLHEIDHCGVLKMEGRLLAAKKCGYLNLNAANFQTTWATEDPLFGADLWVDKFCLLSSNSGVGLGYIILDMPADPRTEYFAALLGRRLHHFSTQYENNNEAEKRRRSRGLTSEIRDEGFSCDVLILSRSSLRGTYERVGMGKVVSHLFSRFSCESSQKFRIC